MACSCTRRLLPIETYVKQLNLVFLRKRELQILANSILIPVVGISLLWESQKDIFRADAIWTQNWFFWPRLYRVVKKANIKKFAKISNTDFSFKFFNRSFNRNFSTFIFWVHSIFKKFFPYFEKYSDETIHSSHKANRIFFGEKPVDQKNLSFLLKNS